MTPSSQELESPGNPGRFTRPWARPQTQTPKLLIYGLFQKGLVLAQDDLCGRVASNARAVLRLLRFGFYDESLVLCRGMGETANLLQLFVFDTASFEIWKVSSRQKILQEFSAVKVRLRLESLSIPPAAVDKERYRVLSERAAHVHPETTPQSHNILGIPSAGAQLQNEGLLVCLNEFAIPLSLTTTFGALILDLEKSIKEQVFSASKNLAEQIGGANITEIENYHREVLKEGMSRRMLNLG